MTEADQPGLNQEIQENHDLEQNAKDTEVSDETEVDIETEIKVELDLGVIGSCFEKLLSIFLLRILNLMMQ